MIWLQFEPPLAYAARKFIMVKIKDTDTSTDRFELYVKMFLMTSKNKTKSTVVHYFLFATEY